MERLRSAGESVIRPWLLIPGSNISGSRIATVIVSPVTPLLVVPPLSPVKSRQGGEYVVFLSCSSPPGQSRPRVTAPGAAPAAEVAVRRPGPVAIEPVAPGRWPEALPALGFGPAPGRPAVAAGFAAPAPRPAAAGFAAPAAAPTAPAAGAAPAAPLSDGTPVGTAAPSLSGGTGDKAATWSPPPRRSGTRLGARASPNTVTAATPAATRLRRLRAGRPTAAPSPAAARRPPTRPTVRRRASQSAPATV